VTPQYERIASEQTRVILVFQRLKKGRRLRWARIQFTGESCVSARRKTDPPRLRNRPALFDPAEDHGNQRDVKDLRPRQSLIEDIEVGIRGLYQDNGYFKVAG